MHNVLKNKADLVVSDIRLFIHLGCSAEERAIPQPVSVTLTISFDTVPIGASNDNLEDTICYAEIVRLMVDFVKNKHFHLVEYLSSSIYELIHNHVKNSLYSTAKIQIVTTKISPPINEIKGGVSFIYSQIE